VFIGWVANHCQTSQRISGSVPHDANKIVGGGLGALSSASAVYNRLEWTGLKEERASWTERDCECTAVQTLPSRF
jgi:hypothetical protein